METRRTLLGVTFCRNPSDGSSSSGERDAADVFVPCEKPRRYGFDPSRRPGLAMTGTRERGVMYSGDFTPGARSTLRGVAHR